MNQDQEKEDNTREMYNRRTYRRTYRRNSPNIGVIIGVAIAGVIVFICLGALIYYFTQRKLHPEDPSAGQGALQLINECKEVAKGIICPQNQWPFL